MPSKNLYSRLARLTLQAKHILKLGTSLPMPERELVPSGLVSGFRFPQQNQNYTALWPARFQFKEDVKRTVPEYAEPLVQVVLTVVILLSQKLASPILRGWVSFGFTTTLLTRNGICGRANDSKNWNIGDANKYLAPEPSPGTAII